MINKTLWPAQSLSTIAIFRTSQRLIILKTSQLLQYTEYRYKLWDSQDIATCVIWRLAFCVWICTTNLTIDFRKSFLWWAYCKLRCALARKVVKALLEKEVSQKGFVMQFWNFDINTFFCLPKWLQMNINLVSKIRIQCHALAIHSESQNHLRVIILPLLEILSYATTMFATGM
jgi:hypothetical protein